MTDSSSMQNAKRYDETVNITVNGRGYDVHVESYGVMSYSGYVIYRGAYFCTLPHATSKRELLQIAEKRIRELQ